MQQFSTSEDFTTSSSTDSEINTLPACESIMPLTSTTVLTHSDINTMPNTLCYTPSREGKKRTMNDSGQKLSASSDHDYLFSPPSSKREKRRGTENIYDETINTLKNIEATIDKRMENLEHTVGEKLDSLRETIAHGFENLNSTMVNFIRKQI